MPAVSFYYNLSICALPYKGFFKAGSIILSPAYIPAIYLRSPIYEFQYRSDLLSCLRPAF